MLYNTVYILLLNMHAKYCIINEDTFEIVKLVEEVVDRHFLALIDAVYH